MTNQVFNERIIFDHLPKTAGQAINSWLIQELGSGCVTSNLIGDHDELIRHYGGEYSVISGHIFFNGDGLDPRYRYVTLFRDPIDRVISWLYFVLKNHDVNELREIHEWAMELIDSDGLVCNNGLYVYISNLYTNHFSALIHNQNFTQVQNAIETVKLYDVIGFYDDMPQFLIDFSFLLGIPAPETIAKVNVTNERPAADKISSQLRERLVELNRLDIEFYVKLREWYSKQERVEKPSISVSPWERYERQSKDRVFCVSEFQLRQAILKEGYDIVHDQALCFEVEFVLDREIAELESGIHIRDTQKRWAFGVNSTLQKQVMRDVAPGIYRISHYVVADLPEGVYTAGFAFAEKLPDGSSNELMWYDILCEFWVSQPLERVGVGYANLPSTQMLTQIEPLVKNLISDGAGYIVCNTIPVEMKPSDRIHIDVEIQNDTDVAWKGDVFRPINLSYHWLDENDNVILLDGVRTSLPDGGVCSHGSALASMEIVAPEQKGKYKLILTMVQESVKWFEEMGFQSFVTEIEVKY